MIVELLEASSQFDPDKATRETFINSALDRFETDALRQMIRQRNGACGSQAPLDEEFLEEHQSPSQRTEQEQLELQMDIASLMLQLPPHLQEICNMLQHASAAEVAYALSISRSTLYRHIHTIREHFEESGFEDFMTE